jgi:hypothetical protein
MNKKTVWLLVLCGLLALAWLQAELRYRQLFRQAQSLQLWEATIRTVDDQTGEPVPITLGSPGNASDEPFPQKTITEGTGQTNSFRVIWAAVGPVAFKVSSEGYEEQVLHLDQNSESPITVRLRRKKAP